MSACAPLNKQVLKFNFTCLFLVCTFFLISIPQSSWAYSYSTLQFNNEFELIETRFGNPLVTGDPVVWGKNTVSLSLNLDSFDAPNRSGTSNQSISWNDAALVSMEKWNAARSIFFWEQDSFSNNFSICPVGVNDDGVNQISWSDDNCGFGWGGDILALTQINYLITESDGVARAEIVDINILVNKQRMWDAYDGTLQFHQFGQPVYDIKRVLLHELGHGLGLTHPDENGQDVTSIMHSRESDTYNLTDDDKSGVSNLYPLPPSSSGGSFDFFVLLQLIVVLIFRFRASL